MVTDQQVVLLKQRRMEGKTQQTSAAMAGMSVRSARKRQCGPLPSETGQERWWRTRTDPFEGVWEEEILPLLEGEAAGRLRATTIIEWLEERYPGPLQCLAAAHPATTITGLELSTVRSRRSTSPLAEQIDACSTRWVGSSRRRAKPWARFLRSFLGRAGRLALPHDGGFRSFSPVSGGFCWPSNSAIRAS